MPRKRKAPAAPPAEPVLELPPKLGPAKRDPEDPGAVYTGPNVRLTLDGGETLNLETKAPLEDNDADQATAAGFDDVSGENRHRQASLRDVARTGRDPNALVAILDRKGKRLSRGR